MARIRILPPEIVSRIAAGEVVERPASVVKELVENAIDANATRIDIDVEEGGKKRITVRDNGSGMSEEDLPLAFESHATSKLRLEEAEDCLFGVSSLGFRGEALASIASVADVEVVSRTPRAPHAWRYRPGRGDPEPAAGEPGTVVEIRDLFLSVPARRKFLRTTSTELSHLVRQVTRLSLAYPSVRLRLSHQGRTSLDLPAVERLRDRIAAVLGPRSGGELLEVREGDEERPPSVRGFVGSPGLRRRDAREQHFFVNGRWVRDRLLTHAVRSAFQGFLIPGFQPVCFLHLELPPDEVDVNVHPMKTEVRFREPGGLYPLLFHAIRHALEPEAEGGASPATADDAGSGGRVEGDGAAPDGPSSGASRERIRQAALGFFASPRGAEGREPDTWRKGSGWSVGRPAAGSRPDLGATENHEASAAAGPVSGAGRPDEARGREGPRSGASPRSSHALQVLDTYIVTEDGDGILLIDQHALHEKILFEDIRRSLAEGEPIRQKLLVPEVVELRADEVARLDRARVLLGRCGFEVDRFGDREIAVHSVPRILEGRRGENRVPEIIREVFRWLDEVGDEAAVELDGGAPVGDRILHRVASIMACKRAVKAGQRLSGEEITALVDRAEQALDPRHCPHGRPTFVRLRAGDLESMFDRR